MALKYGFYNAEYKNGEYDRTYDAEDFGSMFDGLITDGVFKSYGSKFSVTKTGNTSVRVGTGKGWFKGTWTLLDEPLSLSVSSSAPLSVIILEVNKQTRTNRIFAQSAGNSVTLTRDTTRDIYQYCLAYVRVSGGAIFSVESHIGQGSVNVTPWASGLLGGSGGTNMSTTVEASAYTTAIKFKGSSKFDLTFKTEKGLTYVNSFSVTETNGKISKITNNTAGRSIVISYE